MVLKLHLGPSFWWFTKLTRHIRLCASKTEQDAAGGDGGEALLPNHQPIYLQPLALIYQAAASRPLKRLRTIVK